MQDKRELQFDGTEPGGTTHPLMTRPACFSTMLG
jgi:hypothetical protein